MERALRFLLSRDDIGHQRGYWVVASALREAGIEVIVGGMQLPKEIAETALQEDVDIIGYRIMQGAPAVLSGILLEKMKEKGIEDIPVVVGGIISKKEDAELRAMGAKDVFHPLTPLDKIVESIKGIGERIPAKK